MTPAPLRSVAEPVLRAAVPADRDALSRFLTGLSPASWQQRFLAGYAGPPPARVLDGLLPTLPRGRALLAHLDGELVAHALWARADPTTAEVAVVVDDRHQRRGIGTALARAALEDLVAHGFRDVEVFSASTNRAVARMVARSAPLARRELDGPVSTYSFPAPSPALGAAAARTA